jgi:hypothetical protein
MPTNSSDFDFGMEGVASIWRLKVAAQPKGSYS